jgi:leucyl aminopeptidase (aminopeptidase T)
MIDLAHLTKILRTPLELNNIQPGQKVMILTDTGMDPLLWQALQAATNELGAEPIVTIMNQRAAHSTDPLRPLMAAALDPETDLCLYLTSTAMAHAKFNEAMQESGKHIVLMEELTPAMLEPGGPGTANYSALRRLGNRIADIFTAGETVRVTCPNGTDLTAGIRGRIGRSIAGFPRPMGEGSGCAFPDGEAHVCPEEGTGEGRIVFDLTAHSTGLLDEPIVLTVEKGFVTKVEGGRGAQIWREILERFADPNNYNCPAEIAIGLNPRVTPTGSMRTDKKKYGASHIGIGDTIALGGTCDARLRREGVIDKPEISVDGQLLTRGGDILVDEWNTRES